jgi:hypothetical protein
MQRGKSRFGNSKSHPLNRTEQKAAKIDTWVKDQLASERTAGELKRQRLKALRDAQEPS